MSKKIYIYSTKTYYNDKIKLYGTPWLKIGETEQESAVIRVKQQDGTSNPEPLELLYSIDVPDTVSDKQIHNKMEELRYKRTRDDANREWFEIPLEEAKSIINLVAFNVKKPDNFSPRKEQKQAIEQAVNYLKSHPGKAFLLNAKMRFGKTFTAYEIMKKLEAKKVLIVTWRPGDVKREWQEQLENHIDFNNYKFVDIKEQDELKIEDGAVYFTSFQLFIARDLSSLIKTKFDLVIFDEVHWGGLSENTKEILDTELNNEEIERAEKLAEKLKYKYRLDLSGTPFKLLSLGKYDKDAVFTWTYLDEQQKYKGDMPQIKVLGFKYPNEVIEKYSEKYPEEVGFRNSKLFAAENSKFKHPQMVYNFIEKLLKEVDPEEYRSPFNVDEIENKINHMLWVFDNVESVYAMYEHLKKEYPEYKVIPAAGNNKGLSKNTLNLVRQAIRNYKKTITLTCGKLTMGVTVPEWQAVFMMTDTSSIERYLQTIFRAQSPNYKKENGKKKNLKKTAYIIDFDPNRVLGVVYNLAAYEKSGSIHDNIRKLLKVMPIILEDKDPVEAKIEDVIKGGLEKFRIDEFDSQRHIRRNITDEEYRIIKSVEATKAKKQQVEITKNEGIPKGKKYERIQKAVEVLNKISTGKKTDWKEKLTTIFKRIPTYIFISSKKESCLNDILNDIEEEKFREIIGLSHEDFVTIIESGLIDIESLDRTIQSFCLLSESTESIDGRIKVLEKLYNPSRNTIYTPHSLVKEILDKLPKEIWHDDKTFFNPAVKSGIWLAEIVNRGESIDNTYGVAVAKTALWLANKVLYDNPDYDGNIKLDLKEFENMKFDAVVGNPPYQLIDGGGTGDSAKPIYHLFVRQAKKLANDSIALIIPSRWMKGGKGLKKFRKEMMEDDSIAVIHDFESADKFFPDVQVDGGICYILWEKQHKGLLDYFYHSANGENIHAKRYLKNNFSNVIIRDPRQISILNKVSKAEKKFSEIVSSRNPYGFSSYLFNRPEGYPESELSLQSKKSFIKIYGVRGKKGGAKRIEGYINPSSIKKNLNSINKYKLFFSKAYGTTYSVPPKIILGKPGEICTETFLEIGPFETQQEAEHCLSYIKTKFFRALLLFNRHSLNVSQKTFEFIPLLRFDKNWKDDELYKMFNLSSEEISYIEKNIKPMD